MSKYVNEIVKDIRENPQTWKRFGETGLYKNDVFIDDAGNGMLLMLWVTSVVNITINGKKTSFLQLTWMDKVRLEQTFKWWLRNASLVMMQTE